LLAAKKRDHELEDLSSQVAGLKDLSSVLKGYTESIMSKLQPDNLEQIIKASNSNLRDRALRSFEKHPLVDYLLNKSPTGIGIVSLYEAFLNSESIKEVLGGCRYPQEFIDEMLTHPAAANDFEHIRRELG